MVVWVYVLSRFSKSSQMMESLYLQNRAIHLRQCCVIFFAYYWKSYTDGFLHQF